MVETQIKESTSDDLVVIRGLEEMIKNNIQTLDGLKRQLREARAMFNDSFQNDPTYKEHENIAKEANAVKLQTKAQILKQPAVAQLKAKVTALMADMKERKVALSDYLLEYERLTGATQLELFDKSFVMIVKSAKAVKEVKKSKRRKN